MGRQRAQPRWRSAGNGSPDGLALANRSGQPGAHRVVVGHCSFTWAPDENLSVSGQRHQGRSGTAHQVTFAHCLAAAVEAGS